MRGLCALETPQVSATPAEPFATERSSNDRQKPGYDAGSGKVADSGRIADLRLRLRLRLRLPRQSHKSTGRNAYSTGRQKMSEAGEPRRHLAHQNPGLLCYARGATRNPGGAPMGSSIAKT